MHFDVFVIGSGQAGVPLAARLAEAGRTTALAEAGHLGGSCVNEGCTPTKTMIASARAAHVARHGGRLGIQAGEVSVDLGAIVDRKDDIVAQWRSGVRKRLERTGRQLILMEGEARFTGPRDIEVNGERHSADVVVINVGTRHSAPPVPGLDGVAWLTNATVMQLREVPDHLLVLGGGYIGCEFAQMFRRFGADVTIVEMADHLLATEDADVSGAIEEVFRNEGITLKLSAGAEGVEQTGDGVTITLSDGSSVSGSHLLVATGRRPNTDRLDCSRAGIELDKRGYVVADDQYRTSAEGVYAVGDVLGAFPQFTHSSWDDGRILFDILTNSATRSRAGRIVPFAVFTDPQVARVGLTEREAADRGLAVEVATMPFARVARAVETDEPAGIMKVLLDPDSERIVGAAVVGSEAGELIHVFSTAMNARASARAIVDAQFVHPTFSEGLQTLLTRLPRYAL